jgi:hypothetical protein
MKKYIFAFLSAIALLASCTPPVTNPQGYNNDFIQKLPVINYESAIFVSPAGIDDPANGKTADNPCKTIAYGISLADTNEYTFVLIQKGNYSETINILPKIHVIAGYDTGWEIGNYEDPDHQVILTGAYSSGHDQFVAVRADSINSETFLANLIVKAPVASGANSGGIINSSYAIYAIQSNNFRIVNVKITAGKGANGSAGTNGTPATQAAAESGAPGTDNHISGDGDIGNTTNNGALGGVAGSKGEAAVLYASTSYGDGGSSGPAEFPGGYGTSGTTVHGTGGNVYGFYCKASIITNTNTTFSNTNAAAGVKGTGGTGYGTGQSGYDGATGILQNHAVEE